MPRRERLNYLLDTHALVWAAMDEDRLGRAAARVIASSSHLQLAISDVTLQEIGLLIHLDKIRVKGRPSTVINRMLDYVTVLPIDPEIAIVAPTLALPHGDQFDRIITATARCHRLSLITRDANITDAGMVACVWD